MNPIYIILYAIIVTTVLITVFAQAQESSPARKRLALIVAAAGLLALGGLVLFVVGS